MPRPGGAKSFFLYAGAGSGKTRAVVEALTSSETAMEPSSGVRAKKFCHNLHQCRMRRDQAQN